MKRLYSLDILRGFFMFYIIILHALIQRVFTSDPGEFETTVKQLPLLFVIAISPMILISLWGTIFSFITSITVAFQMGSQAQQNTNKLAQIVRNRLITAVMIYFIYFLNNLLFSTQSIEHGFYTHSIITGSLEAHSFQIPTFFSMTASSTLETIAISGLVVSMIIYYSWNRKGVFRVNVKKTVKLLIGLAVVILVISVVLREWIGDPLPHQQKLLENGNYLYYILFIRFYGQRFALFPTLAFAFMGGAMGLLLSQKTSYKKFAMIAFGFGGFFVGIFGLYALNGFDVVGNFAKEFSPIPLQFLNLGLQMMVLAIMVKIYDYQPEEIQKLRYKKGRFWHNYSKASLTIFVFEPFIASGLYLLYSWAFGGDFSGNFMVIISFMLTLTLLWFGILKLWAKVNFKGSCEWIVMKGKKYLLSKEFNRKRQIDAFKEKFWLYYHSELAIINKK